MKKTTLFIALLSLDQMFRYKDNPYHFIDGKFETDDAEIIEFLRSIPDACTEVVEQTKSAEGDEQNLPSKPEDTVVPEPELIEENPIPEPPPAKANKAK